MSRLPVNNTMRKVQIVICSCGVICFKTANKIIKVNNRMSLKNEELSFIKSIQLKVFNDSN